SVLLGNGDGTFQAPRNFAAGSSPTSEVVGDFNGDGRPEFVASSHVGSSIGVSAVFTNMGGGNFSSSSLNAGVLFAPYVAAGDFNGDGITDLAVTGFLNDILPAVEVFNGHAGGALQAGQTYALGLGIPVVGDFNGDGHLDLVGSVGFSAVEPWL